MGAFVLDASVALSWCFPNDPAENTAYSRAVLRRIEEADVVLPEIWALEIANGIFVAHNLRKRICEAEIAEYLDLLKSLPIRVVPGDLHRNLSLEALARKHNLAAYDVAYIDLARRENLPLATADAALKRAALVEGITLI